MKEHKPIIQRIRREAQKFLRRFSPLVGKRKAKKLWRGYFSELLNAPIEKVYGRLYVMGDSHSNFFGGTEYIRFVKLFEGVSTSLNLILFIKAFHLGPATAYNLSRKESQARAWQKSESLVEKGLIPRGSPVLLCFGEIDCRVHLVKQAEQQHRSLEDVSRDAVENYMVYAQWLKDEGFQVS